MSSKSDSAYNTEAVISSESHVKNGIQIQELFANGTALHESTNDNVSQFLALTDAAFFVDFAERNGVLNTAGEQHSVSSDLNAYRKIVSQVLVGLAKDYKGSVVSHLRTHYIQQAKEKIRLSSLLKKDPALADIASACRVCLPGCVSITLLLALQEISIEQPDFVRDCTVLSLTALDSMTSQLAKLMRVILRGVRSRDEDLVVLLYIIKICLLFCIVIRQNEKLAWDVSKYRVFRYDEEDYEKFKDNFEQTFRNYANYLEPRTLLFSRFSLAEPKHFFGLVDLFFRQYAEFGTASTSDSIVRLMSTLQKANEAEREEYERGRSENMRSIIQLLNNRDSPQCIEKLAARCEGYHAKSSEFGAENDIDDFTAHVIDNTRENRRRLKKRKLSRAQQRHTKEGDVQAINERAAQKAEESAVAYKKILHELQQQEHAMKTVDHHKALAMQGKKKKK